MMIMTEDTKSRLLFNVENRLTQLTSDVDGLDKLYIKLEVYQRFLTERSIVNNLEDLKGFLNFRIIIGIINLDLCSAILVFLRGKYQYEAINASRQIITVINEGYKKIYNFIIEKERGAKILKYRNNSFWVKEVGQIVSKEFPELMPKYDLLTSKLDNYLNGNFKILKNQRDLSIHYDKEPIKVYKMLISLNIEETFKKLIPFLDIINGLFLFTADLSKAFLQKTEIAKREQESKIDLIASLLYNHNAQEKEEQIQELKEQILELKNLIN